jgi:hypothetical protein
VVLEVLNGYPVKREARKKGSMENFHTAREEETTAFAGKGTIPNKYIGII